MAIEKKGALAKRECQVCGKTLVVVESSLRWPFCSAKCAAKAPPGKKGPYAVVDKVCAACGKTFLLPASAANKRATCSYACRWKGRRVLKNCARCGEAMRVNSAQKYCSRACADGPRQEVTCQRCGKAFTVRRARKNVAFCSMECTRTRETKTCLVCGAHFRNQNLACCSKLCAEQRRVAAYRTAEPPPAVPGATWIPLAGGSGDLFALVDDADAQRVSMYPWNAREVDGKWYATHTEAGTMQRYILCPPAGFDTDHIDHNTLDNRRRNLRIATKSQQRQNQRKQATFRGRVPTSPFKGVSWNAEKRRWVAGIRRDGHQQKLGYHPTEEAAAKAYDAAARELFGEFARLNFPRPGEQSAHVAASF